jgi:hypothetical protein
MRAGTFTDFIAIDWSGAKGSRHRSIAVAHALAGSAAPKLVDGDHGVWSRAGVVDYLQQLLVCGRRPLVAFDFSFAPPFADSKRYLRATITPNHPRSFWQYVDTACSDEDFGAASFVDHHPCEFYLGSGEKAGYMRLRRTELRFNQHGGGKPSSIFDCVGAAQVAKASFSGMRVLNALGKHYAIWPFDAADGTVFDAKGVIVEMYTRCFLKLAGLNGNKVRDQTTLALALARFASRSPCVMQFAFSDHQTDALIAAAALRFGHNDEAYWHIPKVDQKAAKREGWTFGVEAWAIHSSVPT